jgi:hypothetical protein
MVSEKWLKKMTKYLRDDIGFGFEHVYEWQEQVSLQSIEVEVFWRSIRGEDHNHFSLNKCLEKTLQDHGIGDVEHLKFIDEKESSVE